MAVIQYDTPLEALQAISMFNGQTLFDRNMSVKMDKLVNIEEKKPSLPGLCMCAVCCSAVCCRPCGVHRMLCACCGVDGMLGACWPVMRTVWWVREWCDVDCGVLRCWYVCSIGFILVTILEPFIFICYYISLEIDNSVMIYNRVKSDQQESCPVVDLYSLILHPIRVDKAVCMRVTVYPLRLCSASFYALTCCRDYRGTERYRIFPAPRRLRSWLRWFWRISGWWPRSWSRRCVRFVELKIYYIIVCPLLYMCSTTAKSFN